MHSINHILAATIATERRQEAEGARLARAMRSKQLRLRRRSGGRRTAAAALTAPGQR